MNQVASNPEIVEAPTCDEITKFSIKAHIGVSTIQTDHFEITWYIFQKWHIVDSWEEGRVFIIHI